MQGDSWVSNQLYIREWRVKVLVLGYWPVAARTLVVTRSIDCSTVCSMLEE
jgi:hypothetical protein